MYVFIKALCPAGCLNGGNCSSPGICTCPTGWAGNDCRQGMMYILQTHMYTYSILRIYYVK